MFNSTIFKAAFYSVSVFSIFVFVVLVLYHTYFWGKIYTNIKLSQVPVGGLSPEEAIEVLSKKVTEPETIKLFAENLEFEIKPSDFGFSYDYTHTRLSQFNNGTFEILLRYDFITNENQALPSVGF